MQQTIDESNMSQQSPIRAVPCPCSSRIGPTQRQSPPNQSYRRRNTNVATLLAVTAIATTVIPASSFSQLISNSRSRSSRIKGSSSAVFASTVIPNPQNRNQHVEFWKEYLGLSNSGIISSTDSPFSLLYYSDDDDDEHRNDQYVNALQSSSVCFKDFSSTKSCAQHVAIKDGEVTSDSSISTDDSVLSPAVLSDAQILYQKRKEEWAAKYTSVDALRKTFGTNKRGFWGDLDAKTTRRLYKTLLPRALLELHCNAVFVDGNNNHVVAHPEDLAPLAYKARVAAKMYARERCELPARIAANLVDGFRQWKRYGHFNCKGMSYKQLWEKYASVILHDVHKNQDDLTMEDLTAKICLKILERSCQTNPMIDNFFLKHTSTSDNTFSDEDMTEDLKFITSQLEADARSLLLPFNNDPTRQEEASYSSSDLLMEFQNPETATSSSASAELSGRSTGTTRHQHNHERGVMKRKILMDDPNFHQQKLRLIRSILRLKRKFERFQQQQQQ